MKADHRISAAMRNRRIRRCASASVLLAAALFLSPAACTAPIYVITAGLAVAQVGTTAYANGELQTSVFVDFDAAVASAHAAIDSLDLKPTTTRIEGRSAVISASDLGNRSITIDISKRSSRVCKIDIRVGFWGDQSMSRLVLAQMQTYLTEHGQLPPPPGPGEDPLGAQDVPKEQGGH